MKVIRFLLLVFMISIVLMMVGCPCLQHTTRRAIATRHYYDAPSDRTEREVDEAKRLDRRDILVFELVMAGLFVLSLRGYDRVGTYGSKRAG